LAEPAEAASSTQEQANTAGHEFVHAGQQNAFEASLFGLSEGWMASLLLAFAK
jgi:hypothetical protein